jgi:excisionase family DNA binding protein
MSEGETRSLLTPAEAARRLGQSRGTIYRKISAGLIPAVRLGHSDRSPLRVDERELERWLHSDVGTAVPAHSPAERAETATGRQSNSAAHAGTGEKP